MKYLIIILLTVSSIAFGQLDPDYIKYKKLGNENFEKNRFLNAKKNFEFALAIKENDEYCLSHIKQCLLKVREAKARDEAARKIIYANEAIKQAAFKLEVKTNKGTKDLSYEEGETMKITFRISSPSYLRLVYRLADDRLILLRDDFKITSKEVNKWIELPEDFECSAPFGAEHLLAFASKTPFKKLNGEEIDDFVVITDHLEDVISSSRKTNSTQLIETKIEITTNEKIN